MSIEYTHNPMYNIITVKEAVEKSRKDGEQPKALHVTGNILVSSPRVSPCSADFCVSWPIYLTLYAREASALQIFSFGSIHDIMCLHNQRAVGVILSEGRWCLYDGIWSYDFNDRFCGLTDTYSEFPQYKEITAPTAKWCGYFLLNNSIANRQLVVWKGRC